MSGRPFKPSEIDVYIGQIVANWRNKFGMRQKDLADKIGVTFQQLQKYETAGNRISASRLFQIAQAMEMPVSTLFGEVERYNTMYDQTMRDIIRCLCQMNDADKKMILHIIRRINATN